MVEQVAIGDERLGEVVGDCLAVRRNDIDRRNRGQAYPVGVVFVVFVLAIVETYLRGGGDRQF